MIELLTGENDFELSRAIRQQVASFDGEAEYIDGETLAAPQLADIVSGQSLFASKRLIIVSGLSENTALWSDLPRWLERVADDTHLILKEAKPDKRTATYKWLKKHVDVQEFLPWTVRDSKDAEEWLRTEAKRKGISLTHAAARLLLERVGFNQWQLFHALEKVALLDEITDDAIIAITDARPEENVFALFETALRGDTKELSRMLKTLETSEDPYRVFGLLTSQALLLTALVFGRGENSDVASDFAASPYVVSKLKPIAARISTSQARVLVQQFATTDTRMKSTSNEPWLVIEHMLFEITQL